VGSNPILGWDFFRVSFHAKNVLFTIVITVLRIVIGFNLIS